MYRVSFYSIHNPERKSHGPWHRDKSLIEAWVEYGNKEWPELIHFCEEKKGAGL